MTIPGAAVQAAAEALHHLTKCPFVHAYPHMNSHEQQARLALEAGLPELVAEVERLADELTEVQWKLDKTEEIRRWLANRLPLTSCSSCDANGGGMIRLGVDNWERQPCEDCYQLGHVNPLEGQLAQLVARVATLEALLREVRRRFDPDKDFDKYQWVDMPRGGSSLLGQIDAALATDTEKETTE